MKTTSFISVLLFLLSAVLLGNGTRLNNLGFSPDSVQYVQAAEGILSGHGYSIQQPDGSYLAETHWPPFYSSCIALTSVLTGKQPIYAARYLNAFCLGAAVVLLFLIVSGMARSKLWGAMVAITFAVSLHVSLVYFMALSEGLFNTLLLAAMGLLFLYYRKGGGLALLLASGILLGFGVITRFAGIPFVVAFALLTLLWATSVKKAIVHAAAVSLPGLLMFVGLLLRNKLVKDELVSREFVYHAISEAKWQHFFDTFDAWLSPVSIPLWLLCALVLSVLGLLLYFKDRSTVKPVVKPLVSIVVIALLYVGFLLFTAMYLDAAMPLNNRILFPLFTLGLLFWSLVGSVAVRESKVGATVAMVLLVLFVSFNVDNSLRHYKQFYAHGSGYTSTYWEGTLLFPAISKHYMDVPIYTNDTHMLYVKCNKRAYLLPKIIQTTTQEKRDISYDLLRMKKALEKGAVIVYINKLTYPYLNTEDELNQLFDLDTLESYPNGNIYCLK